MADTFADGIVPVAAPSFAGLLTQPDPMLFAPKPSLGTRILDAVAGGFGQGPDRVGSYIKGLDAGSQVRLRSAQTESALAEAEDRRAKALRQSQINDLVTKAQANPTYQPSVSDLLTIATGAGDLAQGQLRQQELQQHALVADPSANPAAVDAARASLAPGSYHRYYQPATGMIANEATGAAPTVTPVGAAQIGADNALARQRDRNQSGGFTLGGVRYNADGTPVVDPKTVATNAATVAGATAAARGASKPANAAMPAKARQAKAENDAALARIDAAIALVEQYPDSFGLKYALGDTVNQRIDPEGVAARAAVADIGSAKIHERTGATMAAREAPRLTPFVPATTDQSQAIITKLNKMRDYIQQEQNAMAAAYAPAAQPAPATATSGAQGAAPPAAVAYLKQHPELKDQFRAKYGYLPEGT